MKNMYRSSAKRFFWRGHCFSRTFSDRTSNQVRRRWVCRLGARVSAPDHTLARQIMNSDELEHMREMCSGGSKHVQADHGGPSMTHRSCRQPTPPTRRGAHALLDEAQVPTKPRVAGGSPRIQYLRNAVAAQQVTALAQPFTREIRVADGGMLV